jgi:hypothetical protein
MAAAVAHLNSSPRSRSWKREEISQRTKAGLDRARANGKVLGRPKFSDDDRTKLIAALETGDSWHAVSAKTRIPYSTVKKYARALGYEPRQRLGKPNPPAAGQFSTNGARLPTLQEVLARRRVRPNDVAKKHA